MAIRTDGHALPVSIRRVRIGPQFPKSTTADLQAPVAMNYRWDICNLLIRGELALVLFSKAP